MNNDERIRQIVREEMQNQRYGLNQTTYHRHKGGIGGPRVNEADLIPGLKTTGAVTMSSVKDYKFNVNFTPKLVEFYGNPYHNSGGIDRHTFVFGKAALGQNLFFQPDTASSVTVGGKFEIVQTSTMFMALGSGLGTSFQAITSQEHIVDVEESGSVVARATISSYGQNFFVVTVDTLASGWTILGNWFVS